MANLITWYAFDYLTNNRLGEVPLSSVTWSQPLNSSGSLSATINLRDPFVREMEPMATTMPGKTVLLGVIDGAVVWSGVIMSREFTGSTGQLTIGAQDLLCVLDQIQTVYDYSNLPTSPVGNLTLGGTSGIYSTATAARSPDIYYREMGYDAPEWWNVNPVASIVAAGQMISDALSYHAWEWSKHLGSTFNFGSVLGAMPTIHSMGGTPDPQWWMTIEHPLSQRLSLGAAVQKIAGGKIFSSFDYTFTAQLGSDGVPTYSVDFWWPRVGLDSTYTRPLVIDSEADVIDWTYTEDSTQQYTAIIVTGGSNANSARGGATDAFTATTYAGNGFYTGEPLLSGTSIRTRQWSDGTFNTGTVISSLPVGMFGYSLSIVWDGGTPSWSSSYLNGFTVFIDGGPTQALYPPTQKTSSYTTSNSEDELMSLAWGDLSICQWPVTTPMVTVDAFGDFGLNKVYIGDDIRFAISPCERFPLGLDQEWRVVQIDATINDSGLSTLQYTLSMPLNQNTATNGFPGLQPPE